jgi:hypothetical protein
LCLPPDISANSNETKSKWIAPRTGRQGGRATLEGRERWKVFVGATLTSSVSGTELVKASAITIAVEVRNLEDRGLA